jgi:preprotein translocase subunit SecG
MYSVGVLLEIREKIIIIIIIIVVVAIIIIIIINNNNNSSSSSSSRCGVRSLQRVACLTESKLSWDIS